MDHLTEILVPIACGCVLPIVAILSGVRKKMNETNQRTQIVLAAIEKNPDMDIEELLKKFSRNGKLLKEKLLTKLLWGCILTGIGIALFVLALYDNAAMFLLIGGFPFATGVAFLINYFLGKKMLAKEIEAEEKELNEKPQE